MEKGLVHFHPMIVAYQQAPIIAQPGKGAFDLPTFAAAAQCLSVVERGFALVLAMRADEQRAPLQQLPAQRIAVVTVVSNHAQQSFLKLAWAAARDADLRQRAFSQRFCSEAEAEKRKGCRCSQG